MRCAQSGAAWLGRGRHVLLAPGGRAGEAARAMNFGILQRRDQLGAEEPSVLESIMVPT